ncbi:MAG: hypothetical protein JO061_11635 [Acidobacteriaceae bacterium]|nr:hypothetical protein [Acidobacteriaceae bacterium]
MDTAAGSWDRAQSGHHTWVVRFLPSLTDLVFLLPVFMLFSILPGSALLLYDADAGWHLRVGEWILQHHTVPTHDLFSFTKAGQPWFAWEWGWDLLFGAIHHSAGLAGVVLVNVLLLGLVSVLTFRLARRECGNDLLAFLITSIAICGSTVHWLARPHLLSWVFFLAFAHLIRTAENGRLRVLWALPVLTLAWANLHGSFFLGIVMIAIAALAPLLDSVLRGGPSKPALKSAGPFVLAAAGCFLVSFLNPYGWHLHEHIVKYLSDKKQMDVMQEFQSMNFHHLPAPFFEVMLLLGAAAVVWCVQQRKWAGALTLLLWAHLSLYAVRNVPVFLFLAAPCVACMLKDAACSACSVPLLRRFLKGVRDIGNEMKPLERTERFYIASAAGLAFIAVSLAAARPGFEPAFDAKRFPISALPVIRQQHANRIFSTDQWSAFLIYHLYPEAKVFIDDRSDFYGDEMIDRTLHILNARWDWETDLKRFSADMVILPPDAPLATALKASGGWETVMDNHSVIVFVPRRIDAVSVDRSGETSSAVASNGRSELEGRKSFQVRDRKL